MNCPLCESESQPLIENYFLCAHCDLRFLDSQKYLTPEKEKQRYLEHNNDINDLRYQEFVSPLVNEVKSHFGVNSKGLDFGAGTGPVLAKLLSENGFEMSIYDPYFHPDKSYLDNTFDFIVSSEVVEHFYNPKAEFEKLKALLKPNGMLSVMTEIYHEDINFKDWYYRRDPSHVVFYSERTLQWIAKSFGFKSIEIKRPRVATFKA